MGTDLRSVRRCPVGAPAEIDRRSVPTTFFQMSHSRTGQLTGMGTTMPTAAVDLLRLAAGGDDRSDAQLLDDFVRRRDPAAVAAIVRRHGPMVWGVCRRAL